MTKNKILKHQNINPHEIQWLEADWNYTKIHLSTAAVFLSAYPLCWFEKQLPTFLRVHKKAILNPAFVQSLQTIQNRPTLLKVVLINGKEIPVSRRRQPFVLDRLKQVFSSNKTDHQFMNFQVDAGPLPFSL